MNKQVSPKIVSLVFGILILCFAIAFYAVGWDEPISIPPSCVSGDPGCDPPVNVGPTTQIKQGGLGIEGVFEAYGGAANLGLRVVNGNVGIGTGEPSVGAEALKLDVEGPVGATMYCDQDGNNCRTASEMGELPLGGWCGWYANTAGQTAESTFRGNEIPCVINGVSYTPNPTGSCPPGFERVKVATYYISHDHRRNPVYSCIKM